MEILTNEVKITGVKINYFFYCKRQLWFFTHHINMESNSIDVEIGKEVHEEYFNRNKKEIAIDEIIAVDFVDNNGIIHETKKGKKLDRGDKYQILYYIYYLQNKGVKNSKAVVHFPLYNKKEELELQDNDIRVLKNAFKEITEIEKSDKPIEVQKMSKCNRCSYYELCFS
ncbi:CRISPR-associated protein Cas4 [Calorimonas adulescens]|jgi:CRISPR-associated protein Cas4|uniref:CRISPR-associated exonuclease Cas4 n=1 Tax=Calorimonas adulescens TaxID=2606906 RepID=A0A5D8QED1_9THEO|nr:CRISPR-associated protein Cas4 [Calorimonas adulescens]TZE81608.1 CRISPR-associated protein Cas4 [Calorimonas adulescens]